MYSNKELLEMLVEEGVLHLIHTIPSSKIIDPIASIMIEDLRENIQQLENHLEHADEIGWEENDDED